MPVFTKQEILKFNEELCEYSTSGHGMSLSEPDFEKWAVAWNKDSRLDGEIDFNPSHFFNLTLSMFLLIRANVFSENGISSTATSQAI